MNIEGGADKANAKQAVNTRRRGRRLLWGIGIALGVLLLIVLLIPTLLSTGPATRYISSVVSDAIPGSVEMGDLSLGWFGGQRVARLQLNDPEGKPVGVVDEIDMPDASLWRLLRGDLNLGAVTIVNDYIDIVEYSDRTTNLSRALGLEPVEDDDEAAPSRTPEERQEQRADLRMRLSISGGRITYTPHDGDPVEVTDFALDLNAPSIEAIDGELRATVTQAGQKGQLQATGQVRNLFDASGAPTPRQATMRIDADLTDVPVLPLDRLLNLRGRLVAVTGTMESGQVRISGPLLNPDIMQMVARGDRFTMDVDLRGTEASVRAERDSVVRFTVTPDAWPVLVEDHATLAESKLLQPFDVTVVLQNLELPREMGQIDLPEGSMAAEVTVTDVVIATGNERIGTLALRGANMTVRSAAIGESINAVVHAIAEQDGNQGQVELVANLNNLLLADQSFNADGYSATVDGNISDLPMAVLDELAAMQGSLVAMLGPKLQATMRAELRPVVDGEGVAGPIELTARADNLSLRFVGTQQPEQFTLSEPAELAMTLQPGVLDELKRAFPAVADALMELNVTEPGRVAVRLTHLRVPWHEGADDSFDVGTVEAAATATVENLRLTGDSRLDGLEVSTLELQVPQTRLGEPIRFESQGQWRVNGVPSTLQLAGTVTGALEGAMQLALEGTVEGLPVALIDGFADQGGQLITLLGDRIATTRFEVTSDGPERYAFTAGVMSSQFNANVSGAYASTGLSLAEGSQAQFTLSPEAFAALQQTDGEGGDATNEQTVQLREPLTLNLAVQQLQLAWREGDEEGDAGAARAIDPANTHIALRLSSAGAAFTTGTFDETFELRNINVALAAADLREALTINANADLGMTQVVGDAGDQRPDAVAEAQPMRGRLTSQTTLSDLIDDAGQMRPLAQVSYETQTQIRSLPTAMVDVLLQQDGLLPVVLGSQLDQVDVVVRTDPNDPAAMTLAARVMSPRVNVPLTGRLVREPAMQVVVRGDGPATLQLTPEAFAALRQRIEGMDAGDEQPAAPGDRPEAGDAPLDVRLARDTTFELQLQQLAIGFRDDRQVQAVDEEQQGERPAYDPQRTGIIATLRAPEVRLLIQREGGVDTLDGDLQMDIDIPALVQPGRISLRGDTAVTPQGEANAVRGSIDSQTNVTDMVNARGELDLMAARYQTNTRIEELPVAPVDALLGMDNQLVAVLGHRASMRAVGRFTFDGEADDLDITLNSENAQGAVAATIGKDITLREDFVGTLRVTPEVADALLKYGNPLLIDATSATEPIRLTIRHDTFRVPLALFRTNREQALRELSLDAELRLGTIMLQDSWLLGALAPEMQRLGRLVNGNIPGIGGDQQANFTTLQVTVRDGFARSNDLWMHVPNAIVGVQGGVNLSTQYANLSIGLGSQTLRQISALRDYIPDNEIFPISVRGPLSELRQNVDFSPLFGPVATSLAQRFGGDQGALIGGILRGLGQVTLPRAARRDWPNYPQDLVLNPARDGQQPQQPGDQPPQGEPSEPPAEQPREQPRERPGLGDLLDRLRR